MPRQRTTKLKRVGGHQDNPMNLLTHLAINILALLVVDYLLPGVELSTFMTAFVAAVVIGIINTFVRPILQVLALPFSIVTFGLTAFLINVGLLYLASVIVPGFLIDGFVSAAIASILLTLVGWVLHKMAHGK
jgi:putative membrane protein